MRKLGALTILALSWITASCAERIASPAVLPKSPPSKAASKPQPHTLEAWRQAVMNTAEAGKHPAVRSRQVPPSANVNPMEPSSPQAPLQASQGSQRTPISPSPPAVAALPPLLEPAEPSVPITALIPPRPDPAEATSTPLRSNIEPPPALEPTLPILPEVPIEAAMPLPPEPAEPSFPVATLIPPLPEPAARSATLQEEAVTESPISVPFPEIPSPLSLYPHFDWPDVTGSLDFPLVGAFERPDEKQIPSLIRNPRPLSTDTPFGTVNLTE
jgi:hypothetical protein